MLNFLYKNYVGRILLKPLVHPFFSELSGKFLDMHISRFLISPFVKRNQISLDEYEDVPYRTFNEFFCRQIKKEKRPVNAKESVLVSPCDGLLSAYRIQKDQVIAVKQSKYTLGDLLHDDKLAKRYEDGICLVFRLCVHHYHRYCFPSDGIRGNYVRIPGIYHTVRPLALREEPVFIENTREYTVLRTPRFGSVLQMEVGAMLVGRIVNDYWQCDVKKGTEKGHFEYGGSTVILLLEKDKVKIPKRVFEMAKENIEIPVKMGQKIGVSIE